MFNIINLIFQKLKNSKKHCFALTACFLLLAGVFGLVNKETAQYKTNAETVTQETFPGETPLDTSVLSVMTTACTQTDYGSFYSITFSTGGDALVDLDKNFAVVGTTSDLIDYNSFIKSMTAEQRDALKAKIAKGEAETSLFDGIIYSFYDNKTSLVIPETLSRGEYNYDALYTVTIKEIRENALSSKASATTVSIPKTVQTIPANAFSNATKLETIYVECKESEKPAGWETGWNAGAEVVWESNIYSKESQRHGNTNATDSVGNPDVNFIIGYFPNDPQQEKYPLTVEYKLVGGSETNIAYVNKSSASHNEYDGVGKGISSFTNTVSLNIDFQKGEAIDYDSIVIHNIFYANKEIIEGTAVFKPDFNKRYYVKPEKAFTDIYRVDDFIDVTYKSTTVFNGYTSINTNVDKVKSGEILKSLKPSVYLSYEEQLKNGQAYIRYRFTSLGNSKYRILYNNVDKIKAVDTPVNQFILQKDKGNNVSFILKHSFIGDDYSPYSLKGFALNNVTLTLDIVLNGVILTRTATSTVFGCVFFMNENNVNNIFNANTLVGAIAGGYSGLAVLLGVFLFFLFKKIYKNDEFRRLKPKTFVRKGVTYWLTSLVIVLAITFVVLRTTLLKNSIVVYNPVDIFIIFFALASVIIIGYLIKNLVVYIKATNKRKKDQKLGIDKDIVKDGTN